MRESQPLHAGGRTNGQKKGRKEKSRTRRACKGSVSKHGWPRQKRELFSTQRTGLERTAGSVHTPNIKQKSQGVILQQVKGCGSVNRPTPGSQCPAEPATSGFLQGVNFAIFRGRFWGLGVKPWVVNAGFSRCRAILYGVKVWVVAVSCFQQGKQSARLSAVHFVRG